MSEQSKSGNDVKSELDRETEAAMAKRPKATLELEAKDVTPEETKSTSGSASTEGTEKPLRTKPKLKAAKDILTGSNNGGDKAAGGKGGGGPASPKSSNGESAGGMGQAVTHLAAGVAGGLVALFCAAYGLNWATTGGPFSELDRAQFERRIASVEAAIKETGPTGAPEGIGADVTALRDDLESAKAQLLDMNRDLSALRDRADATDKSIAEVRAPGLDDLKGRLGALEESLKALQERPAVAADGTGVAVSGEQMVALEASFAKRLAAAKEELAAVAAARGGQAPSDGTSSGLESVRASLQAGTEKLAADVNVLREQAGRSEREILETKSRAQLLSEEVKATRGELVKMSGTLAELEQQLALLGVKAKKADELSRDIDPLAGRIAALEKDVSGVLAREQRMQTDARKTALAVALTNLKRVIERGEAYQNELETVEKLAPSSLSFSRLKTYATTGVRTPAKLERAFGDAARDALDAAAGAQDGSLIGGLIANARSVVRVRRTGDVPGESAEAVIARMEMRVKEGNLAAALKEAEGLKGVAREAAEPWLAQVGARMEVDDAMRTVETQLIASLGGGDAAQQESEKK